MLDRNDTPWYPTAKLFRQPNVGDWDSVISNVKTVLKQLLSTKMQAWSLVNALKFINLHRKIVCNYSKLLYHK